MKIFLKYSVLLLTFMGFLTSMLELDNNECKQNYRTENHTFICSNADPYQISLLEFAAALPVNFYSFPLSKTLSEQVHTYPFAAETDPPEQLYLRYLVLLI